MASVVVGADVGWVLCREILLTTVQGSDVENAMTAINTFVLEDGVWRIAHHHASPALGRSCAQRPRPAETLFTETGLEFGPWATGEAPETSRSNSPGRREPRSTTRPARPVPRSWAFRPWL